MTGTALEHRLSAVVARIQKVRLLRSQTTVWLLLLIPAVIATLWLPAELVTEPPQSRGARMLWQLLRVTGLLTPELPVVAIATLVGVIASRLLTKSASLTEAARLVERTHPDLNDAVTTAVEVSQQSNRPPSVLAAMTIEQADRIARRQNWSTAVPGRLLARWSVLSALAFVLLVFGVFGAGRFGRGWLEPRSLHAATEAPRERSPITELVIEPGDVEIELGSALTVVARIPGPVPEHVVVELTGPQDLLRQVSMSETVDAGVFAARLEGVSGDGMYRVLYDAPASDRLSKATVAPLKSPDYSVRTFVRPKLEQVDARIQPPQWSGLPEDVVEDVLRLTVVEGSKVELSLKLNKPVAVAELLAESESPVVCQPDAADASIVRCELDLVESGVWTVRLADADGRTPAEDERITIKVSRNQPAVIKATFPGRDTNVSPLQEFLVEAQAADDFGLVDYGVMYSLSDGPMTELSLKATESPATPDLPVPESTDTAAADSESPDATAATRSATFSHQIALESMNAAPDDLVTYSFWAEDRAADGAVRRTTGDLLFAEVRRFEEIFREAQQAGQQQQQQQQQQQGQQQQGSAVDGVLKLQKEILSATWNTQRSEFDQRREGTFTENVHVISQSQQAAIEQLAQAREELGEDAKLQALSRKAEQQMTEVASLLEAVSQGSGSESLRQAVPPEQAIIRTLLQMRAAEFQVRQQQQQQQGGGGGGGGGSASQQQLQQLELNNDRNRYESEQQPQQPQEQTDAQREQLQVLNRLKELARRQQMINERLKELESELRTAPPEEKEELERQLKRLRDEQREMLRDVDELNERMNQSQSRSESTASAEQREQQQRQLEDTRSNLREASRAMDEGRLSEAIAEGTRAERKFEELKEEFRNQTSSQFEDVVKDLRDQARELQQKQEQLGQQLAGDEPAGSKNRPSLKSDRDRSGLQQAVREQRDRLNQVVDQAKQLIEQAEEAEPTLSSRLYDTLRTMREQKPEEALEAAEMLTERGLWPQAQEAERAARPGIESLQKGIEQAAESVVGSEAEALLRAQQQLDVATRQLADEVREATRDRAGSDGEAQTARESQNGEQREGEPGPGQSQNRDPQRGAGQREGQEPQQDPSGRNPSGQSGEGGEEPPRDGQSPGRGEQQGERPRDSSGRPSPSDQPQDGQQNRQPGEQQDGQQSGQPGRQPSGQQQVGGGGEGEQQAPQDADGNAQQQQSDPADANPQEPQREGGLRNGGRRDGGGRDANQAGGLRDGGSWDNENNRPGQPLTGEDYGEWSDRLRDVEELVEDPELRNRVAQVRDRARAMRADFKRHGEQPQWDLVQSQLLTELQQLQQRISQELARLQSDRALVPIDRDPVPEEFDAAVQRYYELLGQERVSDSETPPAFPEKQAQP